VEDIEIFWWNLPLPEQQLGVGVNFPETVEINASIWWVPLGCPVHLTERSILNHPATQYHNMSTYWTVSQSVWIMRLNFTKPKYWMQFTNTMTRLEGMFWHVSFVSKDKNRKYTFFKKLTSSQVQLESVSVECWWFCTAVGKESIWHEAICTDSNI